MFVYYKNSFLASLLSLIGCGLGLAGIYALKDGAYLYTLGFVAAGIPFVVGGKRISDDKAFKTWWKEIRDSGLETQIAAFPEIANKVYQKNPQKRTLAAIRKLNPVAADWIASGAKGAAPVPSGNQPMTESGTVLFTEGPAVMAAEDFKTVNLSGGMDEDDRTQMASSADTSLIDVMHKLESNTQRDARIYWECALALESALGEDPGHKSLPRKLAECYTLYACNVKDPGFAQRKMAAEGLLRALELEKEAQIPVLDNRVLWLYVHSLNASVEAQNRSQLQESGTLLRKASAYRILNTNEKTLKMMNISIPVARCRVNCLLAKDLAFGQPQDVNKALELVNEAAHMCPMDLMRLCDLNPYKQDTAVILTRQSILTLRGQILAKAGSQR